MRRSPWWPGSKPEDGPLQGLALRQRALHQVRGLWFPGGVGDRARAVSSLPTSAAAVRPAAPLGVGDVLSAGSRRCACRATGFLLCRNTPDTAPCRRLPAGTSPSVRTKRCRGCRADSKRRAVIIAVAIEGMVHQRPHALQAAGPFAVSVPPSSGGSCLSWALSASAA